jgi:hypothetical protein
MLRHFRQGCEMSVYILGTQIFKSKHLCEIYVWELDTLYDEARVEWPRFQHDLWHSGLYSFEQ